MLITEFRFTPLVLFILMTLMQKLSGWQPRLSVESVASSLIVRVIDSVTNLAVEIMSPERCGKTRNLRSD